MSRSLVDGYEVLMPLGEGGQASVHLARSQRDSLVALKRVLPHLSKDPGVSQSFEREAELGGCVQHPNVLKVRECIGGGGGLVLDYIEGGSLAELLQAHCRIQAGGEDCELTKTTSESEDSGAESRPGPRRLPAHIAARILLDALAGIEAIHGAKDGAGEPLDLVHRDFTPENLMVGVDGTTRVVDFGNMGQCDRITSPGVVKGKIPYLAPEQILGRPTAKSSDVWAAGALTWELLAGQRLISASSTATAFHQITERQPRRLRSVISEVPQKLDNAISGALVNDPSARYASVREFRRELLCAWNSYSRTASYAEVAEFVAATIGPQLSAQRAWVKRINAARGRRKRNTLLRFAAAGLAMGVAIGSIVSWVI